jgi:hypothetical protein
MAFLGPNPGLNFLQPWSVVSNTSSIVIIAAHGPPSFGLVWYRNSAISGESEELQAALDGTSPVETARAATQRH